MAAFRLGVITDEISSDLEHALDVMLEYNVREVELRELWGKNALKLSADELQKARDAIRSRGMHVCSIASPFYKCALEPAATAVEAADRMMHGAAEASLTEQMQILQRACELANFFEAGIVRVFAFWRGPTLTPELYARLQEAFVAPLQLAERHGVILGLENEHACVLGTGVETAELLRRVNSPRLRAVWDPGNAFQLDEKAFPVGYEAVRPYLAHVHVKDARRVTEDDGAVKHPWTAIGEGQIDYTGQIRQLVQDGYTGVVSLETHYRGAGSAEASSRECLEGLRRLIDAVH